jgi:hypothetical protein
MVSAAWFLLQTFQAEVQDSLEVRIVNRSGNLGHQTRSRTRVPEESRHVPFQVAAGEELEDEIRVAAVLADVISQRTVLSSPRRCLKPRFRSPATASVVRSRRAAISAKE